MRRIDKMTKDQIVAFITDITDSTCNNCPLFNKEKMECKVNGDTCCEAKFLYLMGEIQIKSRWQLCKTDEDFVNLIKQAEIFCKENSCYTCSLLGSCKELNDTPISMYLHIISFCTEKVEVIE